MGAPEDTTAATATQDAVITVVDDHQQSATAADTVAVVEPDAKPKGAAAAVPSNDDDDDDEKIHSGFSFHVREASMKIKGQTKILLKEVAGFCRAGESLAIMGPSGAGKSTLLDILAYRKTLGVWDADAHLDGQPTSKNKFIQTSGYVCSDDLISEELTTLETLNFAANLRLACSQKEKDEQVQRVMDDLKLNGCKNTRVGSILTRGLSTGERKRLNIAIELLPVKSVLFLDEPTTGLDSSTGREIVSNILTAGKQRNLAVIATIHQPSYTILSQFDRLLLLAEGKIAYFGPVADAIPFFEQQGVAVVGNPAEIYAERLAVAPAESIAYYEKSSLRDTNMKLIEQLHSNPKKPAKTVDDHSSSMAARAGFVQITPWHNQINHLTRRQITIYSRNLLMSTSRIIGAIVVGLFFGVAFHGTQLTVAGYGAKAAQAFSLSQIIPLFGVAAMTYWIDRRKLYYHEVAAGMFHPLWYHTTSYLVELVFLSVISAIVVSIYLPLAGWHMEHFALYFGLTILEVFSVVGFHLLCYSMSSSIPYANAAFTAFYYNSLIFGGFFVTDHYLHQTCGNFCRNFYQWTSYMRPLVKPAVRTEFTGYPLSCAPSEILPVDLTPLSRDALNAAVKNFTGVMVAASPSLADLATSNATQFSQTITYILKAVGGVGVSTAVSGLTKDALIKTIADGVVSKGSAYIGDKLANSSAAIAAAKGAFTASTIATNIQAFTLPDKSQCPYANGTVYLNVVVGYTEQDAFDVTPDSFFMWVQIFLAALTFALSYMFVIGFKFQKK